MTEQLISLETANLAFEKGFEYDEGDLLNVDCPQSVLQKWLRDKHYVFLTIVMEMIGSDEWVFAYRLGYLPKENWEDKRRCVHFQIKESFKEGYGTYVGGWDTYEEALENALKESLNLL